MELSARGVSASERSVSERIVSARGVSVGERSVKSYGICKCSTDEVLHSRSGRR